MKAAARALVLVCLFVLAGCAPVATEEPADGRLFYRLTPGGDLLITTVPLQPAEGVEYPPLVSGFADITGHGLALKQGPYCKNACQPNQYGFIGLRFAAKERGNRIVIDVLAGQPVAGEARMDTGLGVSLKAVFGEEASAGEDFDREALLQARAE